MLALSISPDQCIKVLCPIIQSADYPINLAAIKMQTKVMERVPHDGLINLLPEIVPGLIQARHRDVKCWTWGGKIHGYRWLRILRAFFTVPSLVLTGLRQLWEQRPEGLRILFGGHLHSDRRGSQTAPQPTLKQQGERDAWEAFGQIQPFIFQRPSRNTCTLYFSSPPHPTPPPSSSCWIYTSSVPSLAPAAASPHQRVYRKNSRLPPDIDNTATQPAGHNKRQALASTRPTPIPRSRLTVTHTVCLHSHIRVHTALIHFPRPFARWQPWRIGGTSDSSWSPPMIHLTQTQLNSSTLHPVINHSRMKI